MARKLLTALKNNKLEHYFDVRINLIAERDPNECAIAKRTIEDFLSRPDLNIRATYNAYCYFIVN